MLQPSWSLPEQPGASAAIFLPPNLIYVSGLEFKGRGQDVKTGLLAAGLAAALMLTGCGGKDDVQGKTGEDITAKSSAKDIGEAYINEMTRIADALETVDDEASARAAAKKIQVAVDGLNQMSEELDGEISGVKGMQIFGGRYAELIEVQGRVATSMIRIQSEHPELMDALSEEMDRLEN
jgi:hypothetical protein